jgi:hypothetical protein
MAEKKIKTRIQNKHDIEANWAQATSFIPLAGELIVYDPDNNYSYPRFKFGDGVVVDGKIVGTPVTELPFATKDIYSGADLRDRADGINSSNKIILYGPRVEQYWKAGDIYIDTGFNAIFKCIVCGLGADGNDYWYAEWEKIGDINYTHPATHEADMITGLANVATSGKYSDLIDTPINNLLDGDNTNALYQTSEKDDTALSFGFTDLPKDNITTDPTGTYNKVTQTGANALSLGTSVATGKRSVAIGSSNIAGRAGHTGSHAALAMGKDNFAEGDASAAIGYANYSKGFYSTALGQSNQALGEASHAEGFQSIARSNYSHAEGCQAEASNTNAHAEGYDTTASGMASHAEGSSSDATAEAAHAEGWHTKATAEGAHAEGYASLASFRGAHAEGSSVAKASYAHSEGLETIAQQEAAHSEGYYTDASGYAAHAEGKETHATAEGAHSEGIATHAVNTAAHAEGNDTGAAGAASHAEGWQSYAMATCSHAEGIQTRAGGINDDGTPNGIGEGAHAEGYNTIAEHHFSHASGYFTRTSKNSQTVVGSYNADDSSAMFIVGNGTADNDRRNVLVAKDSGRVTIGADPVDPMDVATKQYVDAHAGSGSGSAQTYVQDTEPVDAPIGALWFDTSVPGLVDVNGVEF